jgi:hypothetical protein
MDLIPPKPVILVGEDWRRLVEVFAERLIIDERDLALLTLVDDVDGAVAALENAEHAEGQWHG